MKYRSHSIFKTIKLMEKCKISPKELARLINVGKKL